MQVPKQHVEILEFDFDHKVPSTLFIFSVFNAGCQFHSGLRCCTLLIVGESNMVSGVVLC